LIIENGELKIGYTACYCYENGYLQPVIARPATKQSPSLTCTVLSIVYGRWSIVKKENAMLRPQ